MSLQRQLQRVVFLSLAAIVAAALLVCDVTRAGGAQNTNSSTTNTEVQNENTGEANTTRRARRGRRGRRSRRSTCSLRLHIDDRDSSSALLRCAVQRHRYIRRRSGRSVGDV